LAHIHACWQLTLEGQQRVKSSVEPALALELLLLNLAYLPRLMPLETIASTGQAPAVSAAPAAQGDAAPQARQPEPQASSVAPKPPTPSQSSPPPWQDSAEQTPPRRSTSVSAAPASAPAARPVAATPPWAPAPEFDADADSGGQDSDSAPAEDDPGPDHGVPLPDGPKTWAGFLAYAQAVQDSTGQGINGLQQVSAVIEDGKLVLECSSRTQMEQIKRGEALQTLIRLAQEFFGPGVEVECTAQDKKQINHKQLHKDATRHPLVEAVMEGFDARIVDVRPVNED